MHRLQIVLLTPSLFAADLPTIAKKTEGTQALPGFLPLY